MFALLGCGLEYICTFVTFVFAVEAAEVEWSQLLSNMSASRTLAVYYVGRRSVIFEFVVFTISLLLTLHAE